MTALDLQVKENMSEIRKLWGVSYDKNRKAISGLEKDLKSAAGSLKKLETAAKQERDKLSANLKSLKTELSVVKDLQDAGQSAIVEAKQTVKDPSGENKRGRIES